MNHIRVLSRYDVGWGLYHFSPYPICMDGWDSNNPSKLGPLGFDPESVGWSAKRVTTIVGCKVEYMHIQNISVVMSVQHLLPIVVHPYLFDSQPVKCVLDPAKTKRVINDDRSKADSE